MTRLVLLVALTIALLGPRAEAQVRVSAPESRATALAARSTTGPCHVHRVKVKRLTARLKKARGHRAKKVLKRKVKYARRGLARCLRKTRPSAPAKPKPASPKPGLPKLTSPPRTAPEAGWQLVAHDDFTAGLDPKKWTRFNGYPGWDTTWWVPSQVSVEGGVLRLANSPDANGVWQSAGVGGWNWAAAKRQYGRWDARIRMDPGLGVSAAALLWPADNVWPPEIDFYEISTGDGSRSEMMQTIHWADPTTESKRRLLQRFDQGDYTQWHEVSVRWTASSVEMLVDGRRTFLETDPARIPKTPMWVGFQTHIGDGAVAPRLPDGAVSVGMEVDWVRVYAPN